MRGDFVVGVGQVERKWCAKHGMEVPFAFSRPQRRQLRRWFDFLDDDHSGEIDSTELRDPLLSTGARCCVFGPCSVQEMGRDRGGGEGGRGGGRRGACVRAPVLAC